VTVYYDGGPPVDLEHEALADLILEFENTDRLGLGTLADFLMERLPAAGYVIARREQADGTRKVLMTPEFMERFFSRTEDGRRVSIDWGEPDDEGCYVPTLTATEDDFYRQAAVGAELDALVAALPEGRVTLQHGDDSEDVEGSLWYAIVEPKDVTADWGKLGSASSPAEALRSARLAIEEGKS
jgi:hypothetical protein